MSSIRLPFPRFGLKPKLARAAALRVGRWARKRQGIDPTIIRLRPGRVYILPTGVGLVFGLMVFAMLLGSMNYNNNLSFVLTFLLGGIGFVAMHQCQRNLVGLELHFAGVEPVGEAPLETTEAEAVTGACLLLRKDRFFEIGGMDEGYALHCEDLDLMYRLAERGQERLYVPAARVYHLQGLSSRSRPAWVHWQKHRGMRRFYDKFQSADDLLPLRWLVHFGITARFLLTLPLVLLRR